MSVFNVKGIPINLDFIIKWTSHLKNFNYNYIALCVIFTRTPVAAIFGVLQALIVLILRGARPTEIARVLTTGIIDYLIPQLFNHFMPMTYLLLQVHF